jgi:hypothetical protein
MPDTKLSRRWFALLGGLGILTAAGCSVIQPASNAANSSSTPANGANSTPMPGMDMSGAATPSPAATRTADQIRQAADEMDAAMEARIKAFPARTAKQGNQPLTPKLDGIDHQMGSRARQVIRGLGLQRAASGTGATGHRRRQCAGDFA